MSVESKQMLLHDVERKLGSILTMNQAEEVMTIISEQLGCYDLERSESEVEDIEGKELLEAYISSKKIEGRSPKTLERYQYAIFRRWQRY